MNQTTSSIHPELQDLFARPGAASVKTSLPPDLLQDVPGRLAFLSATMIVIEVARIALALLTGNPLGLPTLIPEIVLSVGMLVVARGQLVSTPTLLSAGLLYEIAMLKPIV